LGQGHFQQHPIVVAVVVFVAGVAAAAVSSSLSSPFRRFWVDLRALVGASDGGPQA
jgi:hypothetical protein